MERKILYLGLLCISFLNIASNRPRKEKSIISFVKLDNTYFRKIGGYPPPNRNSYLPLVKALKATKPRVFYLDLAFIRSPLPSENGFEEKLNEDIPLVLPLAMSNEKFVENLEGNAPNFDRQIPVFRNNKNRAISKSPGIQLPYPNLVRKSAAICQASIRPDTDDNKVENTYLIEAYDDFFFPHAFICILNQYIGKRGFQLSLEKQATELHLMEYRDQKWHSKKKILNVLKGTDEYGMNIRFTKIPAYSAQDFLEGTINIPENQIIIAGPTADSLVSLANTPAGWLSQTEILANEVNTLWDLIKNDLPADMQ